MDVWTNMAMTGSVIMLLQHQYYHLVTVMSIKYLLQFLKVGSPSECLSVLLYDCMGVNRSLSIVSMEDDLNQCALVFHQPLHTKTYTTTMECLPVENDAFGVG